MKTSKFTESQIMAILKQGESGIPVAETAIFRQYVRSSNLIQS